MREKSIAEVVGNCFNGAQTQIMFNTESGRTICKLSFTIEIYREEDGVGPIINSLNEKLRALPLVQGIERDLGDKVRNLETQLENAQTEIKALLPFKNYYDLALEMRRAKHD